jgi:hypothetical protein
MDAVEAVLADIGPCVSTKLVEELVERHGISSAAARQRVSRSTSIKRLAYLPFPRNARFVYRQASYGSPEFWESLASALLEHTSSYGGALAALLARSGTMPLRHFGIACGAPAAQKRHLSPETILAKLEQAKLVQTIDIPGIGACIQLSQQAAPDSFEIARMRARLRTEEVLLLAIKSWARSLGLVSYNRVLLRDEAPDGQPRVGTFFWDLAGPSYLAPMRELAGSKLKPGFLACDVLLGTAVTVTHVKPFISKCRTLRSLKGIGRCLQIFVAEGYEPEAFTLLKSEGAVAATTETLFGSEIAAALVKLADLLADVFPRDGNVETINQVFSSLSKIEGAATNLRGDLFEFIVAEIIRRTENPTELRMNEMLYDGKGRKAEVDVLASKLSKEVRFVECRGYKPGGAVPDSYVERWLDDRIPIIREAVKSHPFWRGYRLKFEFWATGNVSEAMRQRIADVQRTLSPSKYTVELVDKEGVKALCSKAGGGSLQETLDEHFFEHPLVTARRTVERREARNRLRALRVRTKRSGTVVEDFVRSDNETEGESQD